MPQTCKCSPQGPVYSLGQYAKHTGRTYIGVYNSVRKGKLSASAKKVRDGGPGRGGHWEIYSPSKPNSRATASNGNGHSRRADILDIVVALARFYPNKGIEKIVPAARLVDKELAGEVVS